MKFQQNTSRDPITRILGSSLLIGIFCIMVSACSRTIATTPATAQPSPVAQPALPTPPALLALTKRTSQCASVSDHQTTGSSTPSPVAATAAPNTTQPATAQPAASTDLKVIYDGKTGTIMIQSGSATLSAVSQALNRPDMLKEAMPGQWLLNANLQIETGAALRIAAPEVRWLKLRSDDEKFVAIKALGGQLSLTGTCVSSWDSAHQDFDKKYADGRSFILARDGARMDIASSELRYLGYDSDESYGISWRTAGTTGSIVDSTVAYDFYGLYSYEMSDLVIRGNEIHHSVLYGADPHTRSVHLVIENNVLHDNGKHGIILAEECKDSVIRNNVVYNNLHHGIVVYKHSDNNLIENNTSYSNGDQGININESSANTVRNNTIYDNLDAGIGVGQQANQNQVIGNTILANHKDGIVLFNDAPSTILRDNTVSNNRRYGIAIKSPGPLGFEGNKVFENTIGVYLNIGQPPTISVQTNAIHDNRQNDVYTEPDPTTTLPAQQE